MTSTPTGVMLLARRQPDKPAAATNKLCSIRTRNGLYTEFGIDPPLYKKVSHGVSWERKRDIAKSRDHVIKAALADKHPTGEVSRYNWHAAYRYTIDGKERQYTAYFKHPSTPPLYLYLYYVDDPDKLFSCEEYHYENHKAILLFPVILLPWILAGLALVLLGVDLSGF